MADLTEIQAAQAVKVVGSDNTGVEQTPVQSTANGALHTNLRNDAGVEIATASNPLRTDPTGTTTQPISVASLPLPTGASTETTLATRASETNLTSFKNLKTDQTNGSTGAITAADIGTVTTIGANGQPIYTGTATGGSSSSFLLSNLTVQPFSGLYRIGGTWVGTIQLEGTYDSVTYHRIPMFQESGQPILSTSGNGLFSANLSGFNRYRWRATAFTSGTVTIDLRATNSTNVVSILNFPTTQAISASTLPLPTGAATSTKQSDGTQKTQIVDGVGAVIDSISSGGSDNLLVALGATNYVVSTANSTTAQLAAGATFTGAVETAFAQQSFSILIVSDQNGTLTVKQYIDAAGLKLASSIAYSVTASTGFARSGVVNGNYISITFQNNGGVATTTLQIDTAYGTIPSATQLNNLPIAINEVSGLAFSSVVKGAQATNNLPVQNVKDSGRVIKVYSATFTAATTEAMVTLTPISDGTAGGTATTFTVTSGKRFRIQSLNVATRNAAAAGQGVVCQLRMSSSGSVTTTSPLVMTVATGTNLAVANSSNSQCAAIPDGLEFSGTMQFGISQVGTATANNTVTLIGYEY